MKMSEILGKEVFFYGDQEISRITKDIHRVIPNSIYVVIKGRNYQGDKYISDAISKGATMIVDEITLNKPCQDKKEEGVFYHYVYSTKSFLARYLKRFYQCYPMPRLCGITGTSGKSTVAKLLYEVEKVKKKNVLCIGTLNYFSFFQGKERVETSPNTTPDLEWLYEKIFEYCYDEVIMEVSSQGIAEGRILGLDFSEAIFTNLSSEHLDYHKTIEEYAHQKGDFLWSIKDKKNNAVYLNSKDSYYERYKKQVLCDLVPFGPLGQVKTEVLSSTLFTQTLKLSFDSTEMILTTKLIGPFNKENIETVAEVLYHRYQNLNGLKEVLENGFQVEGRMNWYHSNKRYFLIDYAHDAKEIEVVLSFLSKHKINRLFVVVGCGGSRDKEKRQKTGMLATMYADYSYFTEDNSRDEATDAILKEIAKGTITDEYQLIPSRKEAIHQAILDSEPEDVLAFLGKGSEKTMIGKTTTDYDEKETIEECVKDIFGHGLD
jgi:UDP-N-acetylmuramoyl-L-alanyl-D-glutamate--2,6-diaminopimelate ligase